MSHLLWEYYYNEELDKFRKLLRGNFQETSQSYLIRRVNSNIHGTINGNVVNPKAFAKQRRTSGQNENLSGVREPHYIIGRTEINSRDCNGLTLLHRAVSSTSSLMNEFAISLLDHPSIDIYVQDRENGWTPLHRALYFGNAIIAREIIRKDLESVNLRRGSVLHRESFSIFEIIDNEGNRAFDLYNLTIPLQLPKESSFSDPNYESDNSDEDSNDELPLLPSQKINPQFSLTGDEVLAWGSNRNHGLGFRDQDDRHHPEKISLKRPDSLLFRFYREYLETLSDDERSKSNASIPKSVDDLPIMIKHRPIVIQDVVLSKLHSAILTTDPESNLYMCGFGPGGRLGTGDQDTRFSYVPIHCGVLSGLKVSKIALGINHTLALVADGSIFSWGSNLHFQLGYSLSLSTLQNEEPVSLNPRIVGGILKREIIDGVAASGIHSVAYSSNYLFTWGKNEGQLGLVDSESRNLEYQSEPRKVAASLFKAPINSVCAIDDATIVLLSNHIVYVFTNYGYKIVKFPSSEDLYPCHLKASTHSRCYDSKSNYISSITAGGNTIGAVTMRGDLFTLNVRSSSTNETSNKASPSKNKNLLSPPERIWSLRKGHWDGIKSVGITENGCVIICTRAGAVWRRIKRLKARESFATDITSNRKKFKFERIPGLTHIVAVRSTVHGVYVAVKKNSEIDGPCIQVSEPTLWVDVNPLLVFSHGKASESLYDNRSTDTSTIPMLILPKSLTETSTISDLEASVSKLILSKSRSEGFDVEVGTSTSDIKIPVHSFVLGRSSVLRNAIINLRRFPEKAISNEFFSIKDRKDKDKSLEISLIFEKMNFITLFNLIVYIYSDILVDLWIFMHKSRFTSQRFQQVRAELIENASYLKLEEINVAMRSVSFPKKRLSIDMYLATLDPNFFDNGDTIIELKDSETFAHSVILCRRCPFFEGLFNGRAAGRWLLNRHQETPKHIRVNLKHINSYTFCFVLRHIYSDIGLELFADVVCANIDEFSNLVLDVMAVADELMLDRLSQVCQKTLGNFVNDRNICYLLNIIAPYSVSNFKQFALKYICLHLESVLENHLINDLEENLLLELGEVIRQNQTSFLPFVRSGIAECALFEKFPELIEEIKEERIRLLRDSSYVSHLKDDKFISFSSKYSTDCLDDAYGSYNKNIAAKNQKRVGKFSHRKSSSLKSSSDDEKSTNFCNHDITPIKIPESSTSGSKSEDISMKFNNSIISDLSIRLDKMSSIPINESDSLNAVPKNKKLDNSMTSQFKGWSSVRPASLKNDMREIMAQAQSSHSSVSISPPPRRLKDEINTKINQPKLSQKERKKQLHQQVTNKIHVSEISSNEKNSYQISTPWQTQIRDSGISIRSIYNEPLSEVKSVQSIQISSLSKDESSKSLETNSISNAPNKSLCFKKNLNLANKMGSGGVIVHSKRYIVPSNKAEPAMKLPMVDIIGQQEREQEILKEKIARRSLREIQEEQAFQEWWDKESRRIQMVEAEYEAEKTSNHRKKSKAVVGKTSQRRGKFPKEGKKDDKNKGQK